MASSSKKKSSKKKNSELSSKSKRIKKSRRNASKKTGHLHDKRSEDSIRLEAVTVQSSDSNSDNDSTSSLSMSSSSSKGTHRSRKKGSRLKKRDKSRASKRSSRDEDLTRGKKRKRSKKKKGDRESRKKSHKKKPRRHASISSDNDDSSGSATCKSSSTSEEHEIHKHRTKVKEDKKRRVESKIETLLDKERTDKSPKGFSNSRSSDLSYRDSQDRENFVGENKSRRLKSVITVVVKPDEEEQNTLVKDILEEKAVGDLGDIPRSYSVDTSDKRSKRDPPPRSPPASDRKRRTEDFSGGKSSLITQRVSEPSVYRNTDYTQNNIQYPLREELKNESEKDCSGHILPDDGPGENDLESVLRRKALENLKKFRGKVETDVKTIGSDESKKDDDNVDQLSIGKDVVDVRKNTYEVKKDGVHANKLSTAKEKFSWRRLPQQVSSNVTGSAILNESMKPPSLKRDDPRSSMSVQQISDKISEAVKVNAVDPLDTSILSGNPIKKHISSQDFDAKSESDSLLHKAKHSGIQKTTSVSSDKEVIVNKVNEVQTIDETNRKIKDVSAPSFATGHLSDDQTNEAKEGSDFKEKKMTVMRGGEMVEVSYKVYIPQRAAALARRQLKR